MKARRLIPLGIVAVAAVVIAAVAALAASGSSDAAPGQGAIRIGLVSDVGRFNDRSFNQSALEGLKRAQKSLGVKGRPVESRQTSDYVPNLGSLAREGFDLTIGVGFLLAEALNTAAKRYTDSNFAIIDYSVNAPPFACSRSSRRTPMCRA